MWPLVLTTEEISEIVEIDLLSPQGTKETVF